jgi:hypothetical protein
MTVKSKNSRCRRLNGIFCLPLTVIVHMQSLQDFGRAGKPLHRAVSVDTEFWLSLVKLVGSETRCPANGVPVTGRTLISFALSIRGLFCISALKHG